jgi:hypothetical protein
LKVEAVETQERDGGEQADALVAVPIRMASNPKAYAAASDSRSPSSE